MLIKETDIKGKIPEAKDGAIGKVTDLYFDDETWTIRYLVVQTGSWLFERNVLISPIAISGINQDWNRIVINLTQGQIKNSPPEESHQPVSRQYERKYYSYYKWPLYWGGASRWGYGAAPSILAAPGLELKEEPENDLDPERSHLRSINEITGYSLKATDGDIGSVSDFIIDGDTWAIRFLDVETEKWLSGKHVLFSPHWIESIEWRSKEVIVDMARSSVQNAPFYDPSIPITEEYEDKLLRYYRRENTKETVYLRHKTGSIK